MNIKMRREYDHLMPFTLKMTRFIIKHYRRLEHNRFIIVLMDIFLLSMAVYLGFALRFSLRIPAFYAEKMLYVMAAYTAMVVSAFYLGEIYKISWSKSNVEEFARLFKCYWSSAAVLSFFTVLTRIIFVPLSSLAVIIFAGITFVTTTRVIWRIMILLNNKDSNRLETTLIVGAGESGSLLARDLLHNGANLNPIGFIDDNPKLKGLKIASLEVLGGKDIMAKTIERELVTTVIIAMPSATGEQISSYLDILKNSGVSVRVLPSLVELADGKVTTTRLRPLKLEDLLRREPVQLDNTGIENLVSGKIILVTGAGGSIGSEICRQLLAKKPAQLLALGHGEMSVYTLMESLAEEGNTIPVKPLIADVADMAMMENIFKEYRPQLIFHAGAHKHVPLMEENPQEALRVNSFGTWNLATLAGKHQAELMVMISTDKAVRPTSVMGATKRIAERLLFSVQKEYPTTKYMAVRFGNVLGSRGSVVPKFEKQIEKGGPITVTDKQMKRYFMLIPEAVSLVLQAGTMGQGGELFVLDMGEPVNITEMAETLIKLHGYEPYKDINIVFSGIRPGEKLYEELFYDPKHVDCTAHKKIFLTKFTEDNEDVLSAMRQLFKGSNDNDLTDIEIRELIFKLGRECAKENGDAKHS